MFDKNVNIGSHNRAGRDQFITVYTNAPDYQKLEKTLAEQKSEHERLVQRISRYPDDEEFKLELSDCDAKIEATLKEIKDYKENVFRHYEEITRIPINTERLRLAKAHFDSGEFMEAYAVLKVEEINEEVVQLKAEKTAVKDRLAAIDQGLADKANEFLLKAIISQITPPDGETSRFKRTEQLFEQALAAARTAGVLLAYANFLYEHHAIRQAEPLYKEALKQYRRLAEASPEAFPTYLAEALNNLATLHCQTDECDQAMKEYQELFHIYTRFAKDNPEAFLSYVAIMLNNLAILHKVKKEYGAALKEYEKALKIRRSIAEDNSEIFLADVAMTLNNLANLHCETEEYGLAHEEYQEALNLYRRLAETNQEIFLADVAMTLNNLANLHYKTDKYDIASKEYQGAIEIRRNLADTNPEAFLPALTETLVNLSVFHFQAAPDKAKSIAYAEEACSILVPLCAQAPHLQKYLDMAELVLEAHAATPAA